MKIVNKNTKDNCFMWMYCSKIQYKYQCTAVKVWGFMVACLWPDPPAPAGCRTSDPSSVCQQLPSASVQPPCRPAAARLWSLLTGTELKHKNWQSWTQTAWIFTGNTPAVNVTPVRARSALFFFKDTIRLLKLIITTNVFIIYLLCSNKTLGQLNKFHICI